MTERDQSDLKTGLPWQMVEIHEPVRLLVIVEATPEQLLKIASERPTVGQLVTNEWIQLVAMNPEHGQLSVYENGVFIPYKEEHIQIGIKSSSKEHSQKSRGHLNSIHISKK